MPDLRIEAEAGEQKLMLRGILTYEPILGIINVGLEYWTKGVEGTI